MKRILFTALVLLILSALVGCDFIKKNDGAALGNEVGDTERVEKEGAVMNFVSYSDGKLTVKIENNTASTWQSGNMRDYRLVAERDGAWYEVEQIGEYANTMELMIFAPGQTLTHTFSFNDRYGKLSPGKYRVVKSWWANATEDTEAGEFFLECEFTVE